MPAAFADIMTAFLAQEALTEFFARIERRRVDVPNWSGPWPLLSIWIENHQQGDAIGDGRVAWEARYAIVVANKLAAGKSQDQCLAEMAAVIEDAVDAFTYSTGGWLLAGKDLSGWDSDDSAGHKEGSPHWCDRALILRYRPSS